MAQILDKDGTYRYFALVLRIPTPAADHDLGGFLDASTVLAQLTREHGADFLPANTRITRSIEISQRQANGNFNNL